jgi:GT2 family glycosyltransferase
VRLIENSQNIGFASANNQAIQYCTGRYILLLNPDTEMQSDLLHTLIQFLETHSDIGAVGPRTLNPDGSLQTSCYPAPTLTREFWRLLYLDTIFPYGSYRMTDWNLSQPRAVGGLQGSCLLVRRSALDQIGLLDEDYFIYSEEVDLCRRLKQAGWQLYWVPQTQIVHYGGQSTQQVAEKMFLQLYKGKLIYFRKHYGWLAAQAYKLILLIAALLRILLSPLIWLQPPARRQQQLILAKNYRRLVRTLPSL